MWIMYINIGNDMMLRQQSVLGIFDLDNTSTSKRTREFLAAAEQEGQVVPCDDLPKSFVLTAEYGLSKAARPFNSRLDKQKLIDSGFTPLLTMLLNFPPLPNLS